MASTPYGRVAYLLGLEPTDLPVWMQFHKSQTTPTTLSGCATGISSYQLTIAYKQGDDWMIYDLKNSPTTNRHLKAVRGVIESLGYTPTDELKTNRHAWNGTTVYRRYVKGA